ncbi:aldehyde dehydrogenase family protein [Amycolatopsis dongchuanensis]|uniref:Aldehyde dehydrogenase family protein n=2 Tax=Pseudonocardiaceae TaxID=2070 RepID=A0ABP9QG71_9PSEU
METMTIGGRAVEGAGTFGVENPATGRVFAQAPECSPEQLDEALHAAADAFPAWRSDEGARRDLLRAAAKRVEDAADELAALITAEQGKPLADARLEVQGTVAGLRFVADLEVPREVLADDGQARVELVHQPFGVVAAITPWNFPVAIAGLKLGPALLTGNTVVLKPSPFTPLSTLHLGGLLRDVLPPGVLNVVSGSDPLGARLIAHPVPRKISFTGSVATGRKVAAAAADDLKRVTLELGGNDAAILLDDFDVDALADRLFWGAFLNSGQVCAAIKRVYVPRRLHDVVVDALADRARSVVVGDGTAEGTRLGPLTTRPQFERVSELVADALARGATAVTGGGPLDREGYFFQPTILRDIDDGVRLVDEEQFGPALPVLAYDDVEDAIRRANATHYGLDGSVWSADPERAAAVAERLECGTAWLNTHALPHPAVPFGGWKHSGLGVESGVPGLVAFTESKVLYRVKG